MDNLLLLQVFIILNSVSENNHLVGGCVRDMFLKKTPKDFDIVTDIPMDVMEPLFTQNGWTVDSVGKQFLILFIAKDGQQFEIANFRKDVGFSDGRRPEKAEIGDLASDAQRRDFTVNSIYYNPMTGNTLDPNNGMKDLKSKTLRFIGKPQDRIKEDYLRIFRFYRFLAATGFTPETKSLKACRELFNEGYIKTTPDRVRLEIERMIKL